MLRSCCEALCCGHTDALLPLYCRFATALLLLYYLELREGLHSATYENSEAVVLLLYCRFTTALLLLYYLELREGLHSATYENIYGQLVDKRPVCQHVCVDK